MDTDLSLSKVARNAAAVAANGLAPVAVAVVAAVYALDTAGLALGYTPFLPNATVAAVAADKEARSKSGLIDGRDEDSHSLTHTRMTDCLMPHSIKIRTQRVVDHRQTGR